MLVVVWRSDFAKRAICLLGVDSRVWREVTIALVLGVSCRQPSNIYASLLPVSPPLRLPSASAPLCSPPPLSPRSI